MAPPTSRRRSALDCVASCPASTRGLRSVSFARSACFAGCGRLTHLCRAPPQAPPPSIRSKASEEPGDDAVAFHYLAVLAFELNGIADQGQMFAAIVLYHTLSAQRRSRAGFLTWTLLSPSQPAETHMWGASVVLRKRDGARRRRMRSKSSVKVGLRRLTPGPPDGFTVPGRLLL